MAWLIKGGSRDETRNRWTHCDGHWREIARLLAAAIKKGDAGHRSVGSTAGHKIDPFLRSQILQEIIFLTKFGHCS